MLSLPDILGSFKIVQWVQGVFSPSDSSDLTFVARELWRQKAWWPVSWDQSALAESVLELIGWAFGAEPCGFWSWPFCRTDCTHLYTAKLGGLEMTLLGRPGYRSQCLRYLFPIAPLACEVQISLPFAHSSWWPDFYKSTRSFAFAFRNGLVPYAMYCDCWQSVLSDMIGPYRQRRSRLVTFVDPERLDASWAHLTCQDIWSGQSGVCGFNRVPWEVGQTFRCQLEELDFYSASPRWTLSLVISSLDMALAWKACI